MACAVSASVVRATPESQPFLCQLVGPVHEHGELSYEKLITSTGRGQHRDQDHGGTLARSDKSSQDKPSP